MPYNIENITICSACEKELPIVVDLARRIWPETYEAILDEGQIAYMLKMMYDAPVLAKEYAEGIRFDLIFDGGKPIGFASYGPYRNDPPEAKLHKLYLDFAYHGRGIGALTLNHVTEEARRKGYRFLRLNVNKNNAAAIRAYERNGFRKLEAVEVDIGHGFVMDDFVMRKEL